MKAELKKFQLKRLWLLLFAVFALLLWSGAHFSSSFAEWYALGFYRSLSLLGNRLSSLLPFSLAEALLLLCAAAVPFFMVAWLFRLFRCEGRGRFLYRTAVNLVCTVSVVSFLYISLCGVNYSRYSFSQVSGLEIRPSSKGELEALCSGLARELDVLRKQTRVDNDNVMALRFDSMKQAGNSAQDAMLRAAWDYPTLSGNYGPPKTVLASHAMSYLGITGIFIPFTLEANVNIDVPAYTIPFTMCHELSHLRGYMREDEANFIAYLACERSESPDFQYSGKMLAFTYASNALWQADQEACKALMDSLHEGVKRDLDANNQYWDAFEGPVSEAAGAVNDAYLKANKQTDGVQSYGRVVDLLLAEYRQKSGTE